MEEFAISTLLKYYFCKSCTQNTESKQPNLVSFQLPRFPRQLPEFEEASQCFHITLLKQSLWIENHAKQSRQWRRMESITRVNSAADWCPQTLWPFGMPADPYYSRPKLAFVQSNIK
eukprot:Filipodium_phascolosomae@DN4656_c0_g1_i1.p1